MPALKTNKLWAGMKMPTISEKRKRFLRLGFTRYVVENYGMNMHTAYSKFRNGMFRKWEMVGILGCISCYINEDYKGSVKDFYDSLSVKSDFLHFMCNEMQMSERTARERFRKDDFCEIELKGFENIYQEFVKSMNR